MLAHSPGAVSRASPEPPNALRRAHREPPLETAAPASRAADHEIGRRGRCAQGAGDQFNLWSAARAPRAYIRAPVRAGDSPCAASPSPSPSASPPSPPRRRRRPTRPFRRAPPSCICRSRRWSRRSARRSSTSTPRGSRRHGAQPVVRRPDLPPVLRRPGRGVARRAIARLRRHRRSPAASSSPTITSSRA